MNAPVFEASRMRTQRATKFIDELKDELRKYAKSETLTASAKFTDNCEPQITLSWPGVGLNPGAILGGCIHNMRTALDLMASELARLNQQNDKNVYFPFAASIDDFPDAIKNRHFDKCGQDAVDLLKTFSLYKGGNEKLRAIHDLDIQDKHTSLILTMATQEFYLQGDVTCLPGASYQVPVTTEGHQFTFPPGPLASLPVIETLGELVRLIEAILLAFARMVESRICSYECTFCVACVEHVLGNVCPNCGGGFVPRPVRPSTNWNEGNFLGKDPAAETLEAERAPEPLTPSIP